MTTARNAASCRSRRIPVGISAAPSPRGQAQPLERLGRCARLGGARRSVEVPARDRAPVIRAFLLRAQRHPGSGTVRADARRLAHAAAELGRPKGRVLAADGSAHQVGLYASSR
jgi:hypothetical protein